jgi:hypothetical protein
MAAVTLCRFKQEGDAMESVTSLAADMRVFAPEHILVGNYLYGGWDANLVQQLLSLMAPDVPGLRIDLQTSEYDKLTEGLAGSFEARCRHCRFAFQSCMRLVQRVAKAASLQSLFIAVCVTGHCV